MTISTTPRKKSTSIDRIADELIAHLQNRAAIAIAQECRSGISTVSPLVE
jgi:hypothetical protein